MADIYFSSTTGKTVTAQLYNDATSHGDPIPMSEIEATGEYVCDIPTGTPANKYLVVFFEAGEKLASGVMEWDGVAEVNQSVKQMIDSAFSNVGSGLGQELLAVEVEPGATIKGSLRLVNAFVAGKVRGAGSNVEKFSNLAGTHDVIVSTNDAQGNRRAVQLNLGD